MPRELKLVGEKCPVSFETLSAEVEKYICSVPYLVCTCCELEEEAGRCSACMYAVGFHTCQKNPREIKWKKGTLHGGTMDFQRVLFLYVLPVATASTMVRSDHTADHDQLKCCHTFPHRTACRSHT